MQPKLSICIPTYNRAAFLEQAFERLLVTTQSLPFSYEIVVSDNASTDGTPAIVFHYAQKGLPVRYYRCAENTGYLANHASALRLGAGEYLVYLADDDQLLMEGLCEAVAMLEARPDVVACYAPWFMYNEVDDRDIYQFYRVEKDFIVDRGNFKGTFDFLIKGIVFPEILVYRASAFRAACSHRHLAFWAFSHLAHYLDMGNVAFLKKPFYRSTIVSRLAPNSDSSGVTDTMTSWDRYRGGLEYFLYFGMKRGSIVLNDETWPGYNIQIRGFIVDRLRAAQRLWLARKDYLAAYEIHARLSVSGELQATQQIAAPDTLRKYAAAQSLTRLVNVTAGVRQLVIANIQNGDSLLTLLRELGLRKDIEVVMHRGDAPEPTAKEAVVFVRRPAERDAFVEKGYLPNLVVCEDDLLSPILV